MNDSKSTDESTRKSRNTNAESTQRDKRTHREIVEANLRALKHTRMAFQR